MNEKQLTSFRKYGYLLIESVLDVETVIDPLVAEYDYVLNLLSHELCDQGMISSTYKNLSFMDRLVQIYQETGRDYARYFDCSLPLKGVSPESPIWVGPAVFSVLTNESVLDLVEALIGGEIYSNPVQHVRIKPPEQLLPAKATDNLVRATMWHQDNGVVNSIADQTDMLTVWISVTNASVESGCLQIIPGSHREKLITHCPPTSELGQTSIPDSLLRLDRAVPIPTSRGDVILMHKHTCHSSLPNSSNKIRLSLDLRYNPIGQPTGRDHYPGFVARSRNSPSTELRDPAAWAELWYSTREQLSLSSTQQKFPDSNTSRWNRKDPNCA